MRRSTSSRQSRRRGAGVEDLAGGQRVAGAEHVAAPDLERVEPDRARQAVDLALDGELRSAARRSRGRRRWAACGCAAPAPGCARWGSGRARRRAARRATGRPATACCRRRRRARSRCPWPAAGRRASTPGAVADARRVALGGADDVLVAVVGQPHRAAAGRAPAAPRGTPACSGSPPCRRSRRPPPRRAPAPAPPAGRRRGPAPCARSTGTASSPRRPASRRRTRRSSPGTRCRCAPGGRCGTRPRRRDRDSAKPRSTSPRSIASAGERRPRRRLLESQDRRQRLVLGLQRRERRGGRRGDRRRHQRHRLADVPHHSSASTGQASSRSCTPLVAGNVARA